MHTQKVLICLLEEWKERLDKIFLVDAVLIDHSKFDCIPQNLIIAKLVACGSRTGNFRLIYSYLKGRKQCAKIKKNT